MNVFAKLLCATLLVASNLAWADLSRRRRGRGGPAGQWRPRAVRRKVRVFGPAGMAR
ncbi:hypothetical protein LP414_31000 [Polaromonas sp. P1(28)-13]|nr:hypothetical protein LP414_31000 [Polaromonas sp. P1(28)-13]